MRARPLPMESADGSVTAVPCQARTVPCETDALWLGTRVKHDTIAHSDALILLSDWHSKF